MIRSGRRSPRFRRSSGARRRRCASGCDRPIPASAGMTCDRGGRAGLSSEERRRLKELERENRELRRANEILRKASAYLSTFGRQHHHHSPRRSTSAARDVGVVHRRPSRSIRGRADVCASAAHPIDGRRAQGARRGAGARPGAGTSRRVAVRGNSPGTCRGVYGVRKVWRQTRREGVTVACCAVARLMQRMGLQGAVRGWRAKTTHSVVQGERPDDRVHREFKVSHPNALWVSDPRFHHSGAGSM